MACFILALGIFSGLRRRRRYRLLVDEPYVDELIDQRERRPPREELVHARLRRLARYAAISARASCDSTRVIAAGLVWARL